MKGTMSELELSLFRQRSQEALKQKARRGALFLRVAAAERIAAAVGEYALRSRIPETDDAVTVSGDHRVPFRFQNCPAQDNLSALRARRHGRSYSYPK
jgi:hypothetical protein